MDTTAKPRHVRARQQPLPANKFIVLVGLMGAGKSNVGKRVASIIGLPFVDTDAEIEAAADSTIEEIFEQFGEKYFRKGERRVIRRLLDQEPAVLATGGGAFMDSQIRTLIHKRGISVWLRADLDLLVKRTGRRDNRPLLKIGDRRNILKKLMEERHPIYEKSDIVVDVRDEGTATTAKRIALAIDEFLSDTVTIRVKS